MIKISVIIPVYNVAKYLKQCLDSVLNQTLKEIEIIVINDGSNDESASIIQNYANIDKRIIAINTKHKGAANARNIGLKLAKGDYLFFLDSDDWLELYALEKLYKKIIENDAQIVICKNIHYNNITKEENLCIHSFREDLFPKKRPFSLNDAKENALQLFVGWPWDKLYSRKFVSKTGISYQNVRSTNDLYFVLAHLFLANKIDVLKEPLVFHRTNNANSLENTRYKDPCCFLIALRKFINFLKKNKYYDDFIETFYFYLIDFAHWHYSTHKDEVIKENMRKRVVKLFNAINLDAKKIKSDLILSFYKTLTNELYTFQKLYLNGLIKIYKKEYNSGEYNKKIYLLHFLPLLKLKKRDDLLSFYLFGFIKICSTRRFLLSECLISQFFIKEG